ncbi:MAG TPA: hypothetical protein VK013_15205 [Myxococcaceae bacterium]|nr:hypothetical protein [Myxococcaceae bacterium]
MRPRLEVAELLSFRLRLPKEALDEVLSPPGDTFLTLTREGGDLVLADSGADSFLRFKQVKEELVLTDVALLNDPRARFLKVLAALLIRFEGDLEAQLVWSDAQRNTVEGWTDLRVHRGQTEHPALAVPRLQNQLRQVPEALSPEGGAALFTESEEGPAPDEAEEIARLLVRAEAAWSEYQRLKNERTAPRG